MIRPASRLVQPARGYRYSVDSLLLVEFAARARAKACLDLGTGSGVIAIRLLESGRCGRAVGVERDAQLADCARENCRGLGLEERLSIVEGDLRTVVHAEPPGRFDLVVANPPFHRASQGARSPDARRASARHEGDTTLVDFVTAARHALGRRGRLCIVLPVVRLLELTALLQQAGLPPRRVCFVHPTATRPARVVLCEAAAGKPGGVLVEPARIA